MMEFFVSGSARSRGVLMKMRRVRPLLTALVLTFFMVGPGYLSAQVAATARRDAYTPVGQRLTSAMVTNELERRMQLDPRNEASLWNTGYDFYRNFPPNQATARAIEEGFLRARPDNVEQRAILTKAAIYWQKIHFHGRTNVPVGLDNTDKGKIYYGRYNKISALSPSPSGSHHKSYPSHV